ncbi:unnamed protein product [Pylaiella littoralis]
MILMWPDRRYHRRVSRVRLSNHPPPPRYYCTMYKHMHSSSLFFYSGPSHGCSDFFGVPVPFECKRPQMFPLLPLLLLRLLRFAFWTTRTADAFLLRRRAQKKDALYGSVELEPVIQRLMDTPQFQRLHGLKQLGTSDSVYRSCTHTRFEHSVGVAHLAQRFAEGLRRRQPELGITAADVMCVKIAGLLHDLGHGPFSHMWDGAFVERMGVKWKHETGSVKMMRYMLRGGSGGPRRAIDLSAYEPRLDATDVVFIEEMILGTPEQDRKGRGPEKEFLYDIVNNTRSGLDVDKLDYFRRDARSSVGERTLDLDRFIELARVLPAQGEDGKVHKMVCYPDKLWVEALGLFRNRMELHSSVYQHKGGKSVELMLVDAFAEADPYFTVPGTVNEKHPEGRWRLSEAVFDCKAYTCLKDSLVDLVMNDPNPGLKKSKEILSRLEYRDLYPCVGTTECDYDELGMTEKETGNAMVDMLGRRSPAPRVNGTAPPLPSREPKGDGESDTDIDDDEEEAGSGAGAGGGADDVLEQNDIIVEFMRIHWGLKQHNPVSRLRFFSKYASMGPETQGVRLDEDKYASFMPQQFDSKKIRVFVRNASKVDAARKALELFCLENGFTSPTPLLLSPAT